MLNNEEILRLILKYAPEHGITAYELGQKTSLTQQSAWKILEGKTKNPRRQNLLEILDYIEKKRVGSALPGHPNYDPKIIAEPTEEIAKASSQQERWIYALEKISKQHDHIIYLESLLTEKNIPFERYK